VASASSREKKRRKKLIVQLHRIVTYSHDNEDKNAGSESQSEADNEEKAVVALLL